MTGSDEQFVGGDGEDPKGRALIRSNAVRVRQRPGDPEENVERNVNENDQKRRVEIEVLFTQIIGIVRGQTNATTQIEDEHVTGNDQHNERKPNDQNEQIETSTETTRTSHEDENEEKDPNGSEDQ